MKAITGGKVPVGSGKVYGKGAVLFDEGKTIAVWSGNTFSNFTVYENEVWC